MGFGKHGGENEVAEVVAEGGVVFRYCKSGPESGSAEDEFLARKGQGRAWPGSAPEPGRERDRTRQIARIGNNRNQLAWEPARLDGATNCYAT